MIEQKIKNEATYMCTQKLPLPLIMEKHFENGVYLEWNARSKGYKR